MSKVRGCAHLIVQAAYGDRPAIAVNQQPVNQRSNLSRRRPDSADNVADHLCADELAATKLSAKRDRIINAAFDEESRKSALSDQVLDHSCLYLECAPVTM